MQPNQNFVLIFLSLFLIVALIYFLNLFFKDSNNDKKGINKIRKTSLPYQCDEHSLNELYREFEPTIPSIMKITTTKGIEGKVNIFNFKGSSDKVIENTITLSNIFKSDRVLEHLSNRKQIIIFKTEKHFINDELKKFEDFITLSKNYKCLILNNDQIESQKAEIKQAKDAISYILDNQDNFYWFFESCNFKIDKHDDEGSAILIYDDERPNSIKLQTHLRKETITANGKDVFSHVGNSVRLNILGKTCIYTKNGKPSIISLSSYLIF